VTDKPAVTGGKQTLPAYRGRFAPSPSGPLHFGSLVAAVASYLQALVAGGEWLVRIEDIDPPREPAGAAEQIISALRAHGFRWSGDILFQRHHLQRFDAVAESLLERGLAFACTCSREKVRETAKRGPIGPIYPGTCRDKIFDGKQAYAIRMRTARQHVSFADRLQGQVDCSLDKDIGDFVIRRKDGLIAYSLAVVLDDHHQGITEVVRGVDLLQFTAAQIHLQRVLALETPTYMHVPVAVTRDGDKLSKQTGAPALNDQTPVENLFRCLDFLRQKPPTALRSGSLDRIWVWARANWRPENLANYRNLFAANI
jgi:glutamyl-Q tRNA(Asp) synthetase